MNDINYKETVIQTIQENYSQTLLKKIHRKLKKENIISKEENLITLCENIVQVDGLSIKEDIIKAINLRETDTLKIIDELEFFNGFKYSALYKVDDNFANKLNQLFGTRILNFHEQDNLFDNMTLNFQNPYDLTPTYFKISEKIHAFKFCLHLVGYQGRENPIKKHIKYPVIAYYFEEDNILDIRLDSLKSFLKNGDEFFYTRKIERIASWFNTFCSKVRLINLSPIIDYIAKKDCPDVNVAAQSMNHISGSRTILDTGTDNRAVLPILGDLKKLISDHQSLFMACKTGKKINELFLGFIEEIEETSDLPWISLSWIGDNGKSNARVKFSFGYKGTPLDVLQYYNSSATEMEKMNYVVKYIIDHKIEYEAEGTQPTEAGQIV